MSSLLLCSTLAIGPGSCWLSVSGTRAGLHWQIAPTAEVGWPVNRIGIHAAIARRFGSDHLAFTFGAQGSWRAAARDLGIPGPRIDGVGSLLLTVSLGPVDLGYAPLAYVDTRGTSQVSGALTVGVTGSHLAWTLRFENDYLAFLGEDGFRTAAIETWLGRRRGRWPWGVGAQLQLWTATTRGLEALDFGETYDLSGQRGEGYSHGLLCLLVTLGPLQACVGVDAEPIRDVTQNRSVHRWIDDGALPLVDRTPQPAFRLSVNRGRASY